MSVHQVKDSIFSGDWVILEESGDLTKVTKKDLIRAIDRLHTALDWMIEESASVDESVLKVLSDTAALTSYKDGGTGPAPDQEETLALLSTDSTGSDRSDRVEALLNTIMVTSEILAAAFSSGDIICSRAIHQELIDELTSSLQAFKDAE